MQSTRTLLCFALVFSSACTTSNNLLLGRVEARAGTHPIVVTDCYRFSVDPPAQEGETGYRFTPCKDADILIRDERLMVNGQSYGPMKPGDGVLVDHSVVSILSRAPPVASRLP